MRCYLCLPVVFLVTLTSVLAAEQSRYVHPELLLEPSELARPEVASQFIVLDARKQDAYEQEHIPGARWVDQDAWKTSLGDGTDVAEWSRRIGELGIAADSKVVVYDDVATRDAARIWWTLRYWGVENARLLNGGWKAWKAQDLPTSSEQPAPANKAEFNAVPHRRQLVTKSQVLRSLDSKRLQILDTRSDAEFCGTDLKENKRGGAIPGAMHLDWVNLTDPDTHRFKSARELQQLFDSAGLDLSKPIASHCQSGGRASVMAFALELMGAKDSRNYYRGWSEWGNLEDTPIVIPESKSP